MGYIRDARLSSGYANGNTVHGMAEEIRLTDEDSISETPRGVLTNTHEENYGTRR